MIQALSKKLAQLSDLDHGGPVSMALGKGAHIGLPPVIAGGVLAPSTSSMPPRLASQADSGSVNVAALRGPKV